MSASHFDIMSHTFKCPQPQCGEVFKKTYRSLLHPNVIPCPKCGMGIDIAESKRTGEIGLWFNTVSELDKKTNEEK